MGLFGRCLFYLRKRKGLTHKDLIDQGCLKVSKTYLTKIEKQEEIPSPEIIKKLVNALDWDIDDAFKRAKQDLMSKFKKKINKKYKKS